MRTHFPPNPKIGDRRIRKGFLWRPKTLPTRDKEGVIIGFERRWLERARWVEVFREKGYRPHYAYAPWYPWWRAYAWSDLK